jgi:hypothetical protein
MVVERGRLGLARLTTMVAGMRLVVLVLVEWRKSGRLLVEGGMNCHSSSQAWRGMPVVGIVRSQLW